MTVHKCLECSHDLTSLFQTDEHGVSHKLVTTCPECLTRHKLTTEGHKKETLVVIPNKPIPKTLDSGPYKVSTIIGKATDAEMALLGKATCMQCYTVVNLLMSYLVRMSTLIFPKEYIKGTTISPIGELINTLETLYRPPIKKTGRLCKSCYDLIPSNSFIPEKEGYDPDYELLKDPINMMRDGIKNVPISPSMRASRYESNIFPKEYIPEGRVYNELVLGFGCDKEFLELCFKPAPRYDPTNPQPGMIDKLPRLKPYRWISQTIQLHPSRRVRKIKIPNYPWVQFATNKERREAFKERFLYA